MARLLNNGEMQGRIQNIQVDDKFITKSRVITTTDLGFYAMLYSDTYPVFLSEE